MQTLLFLIDCFGVLSWVFLLGCALAGAAFAHASWAYKQTQILHLRREQSRLQQALALRERSLAGRSLLSIPAPETPQPPVALPQREAARKEVPLEPLPARTGGDPVATRTKRVTRPAAAALEPRGERMPRRNSLREDRQLGLVFYLAPEDADPLERLPSITPAQVRDLNMLGVYKFEQVARWNETNLRSFALLLGLGVDDLAGLDWVRQAKVLHGELHGSKMILAS